MLPQSKILNHIVFIAAQLKWALNYVLLQSFSYPYNPTTNISTPQELGIRRFQEDELGSSESVECAVCLCKIEEGEEIRELRCDHLFHKVCLDRWMGCGRKTCPLCRNHLKSPTVFSELHQEVIVLDFFSGKSRRDRYVKRLC